MLYGLYLSAQGARAQSMRLDAVSNNLANAGTTAFKKALAVFQNHRTYDVENGSYRDVPGNLNSSTGGTTTADVVTDFAQGPLEKTGNKLDIALTGNGFLQVADGKNRQFLSRNGSLALTKDGDLVQAGTGNKVLSHDGQPIRLPADADDVLVDADGMISVQTGDSISRVAQIGLHAPQKLSQLRKVGDSQYEYSGRLTPANGSVQVQQGYLEGSGVKPVSEMLEMIQSSRSFETNINMIRIQDESLARLLQSIPRR